LAADRIWFSENESAPWPTEKLWLRGQAPVVLGLAGAFPLHLRGGAPCPRLPAPNDGMGSLFISSYFLAASAAFSPLSSERLLLRRAFTVFQLLSPAAGDEERMPAPLGVVDVIPGPLLEESDMVWLSG